jgi:two-component system KDP operon response regulator KdpE
MTADLPLILVIEDEKPIRRFLKASLQESYRYAEAETGRQGLIMASSQPPDLIILDLGLPDIDGIRIIDELRGWSQVPIIILSARDQEKDKVAALDGGADDYLTKPFGMDELLARIRVALRHRARKLSGEDTSTSVYDVAELRIDMDARRVFLAGNEVHLTPNEYRLLTTLVRYAGKVLTHRQLLQEVWGPGNAEEVHYLRVCMANLRRKIEANPARPKYLLTEQGVGYRFADEGDRPDQSVTSPGNDH